MTVSMSVGVRLTARSDFGVVKNIKRFTKFMEKIAKKYRTPSLHMTEIKGVLTSFLQKS
jgi:hypothetical protein